MKAVKDAWNNKFPSKGKTSPTSPAPAPAAAPKQETNPDTTLISVAPAKQPPPPARPKVTPTIITDSSLLFEAGTSPAPAPAAAPKTQSPPQSGSPQVALSTDPLTRYREMQAAQENSGSRDSSPVAEEQKEGPTDPSRKSMHVPTTRLWENLGKNEVQPALRELATQLPGLFSAEEKARFAGDGEKRQKAQASGANGSPSEAEEKLGSDGSEGSHSLVEDSPFLTEGSRSSMGSDSSVSERGEGADTNEGDTNTASRDHALLLPRYLPPNLAAQILPIQADRGPPPPVPPRRAKIEELEQDARGEIGGIYKKFIAEVQKKFSEKHQAVRQYAYPRQQGVLGRFTESYQNLLATRELEALSETDFDNFLKNVLKEWMQSLMLDIENEADETVHSSLKAEVWVINIKCVCTAFEQWLPRENSVTFTRLLLTLQQKYPDFNWPPRWNNTTHLACNLNFVRTEPELISHLNPLMKKIRAARGRPTTTDDAGQTVKIPLNLRTPTMDDAQTEEMTRLLRDANIVFHPVTR